MTGLWVDDLRPAPPVVLWLCENDRWPPEVRIHTANPVGREWLTGMARRYGPGVR